MKCAGFVVAGSGICGFAAASHGQCNDAYDDVLCVSKLDAAAASGFDATDGQLSGFWGSLEGDYFEIDPSNSQFCDPDICQADGPEDAKLYVKAAATNEALYLYFEVQDNVWVDWTDPSSYGDDSIDMYFDEMTGEEVWNCTDCHAAPYGARMSYTTKQFQVFMGATTIPTELRMSYYDEAAYTWVYKDGLEVFTFDEIKEKVGLEIEVVEVDATHKVQEWKFPWSGIGDGLAGTDLGGRKIAFAGGYNDMDGDNDKPDQLRWPGPVDPWLTHDHDVYGNQWGDLLLPDLSPVVPRSTRKVAAALEGTSTHLYTLTGQRISADKSVKDAANGVLVQRHVLQDGSVVSGRMRIAR